MLSLTTTHHSIQTGNRQKASNRLGATTGWNNPALTLHDVLTVIVVYLILASIVAGASILFEQFVKLP
jgi:hypothetical protein